jgi:putative membrane protein
MSMFYGGWMIFGFLFFVAIVGLVIWAVVTLTRRGTLSSGGGDRRMPLDIAKERYARGEITRDEFERIKKDLE